jgi:uncharacterized repeat protein (TIGR04076 family)
MHERSYMVKDPGLGYKVTATIVTIKGECSAGHKAGDSFEISCHNSGGLCGFFYHQIFPNLQMFQFGGTMPGGWEKQSAFMPG